MLMIINHRLENQNGYAFSPDAAKQVASGLVKSAEASLALRDSSQDQFPVRADTVGHSDDQDHPFLFARHY